MKILFTADLHGLENLYEELFSSVRTGQPDAVLLGGDLFPRGVPSEDSMEKQRVFIQEYLGPRLSEIRLRCPSTEWFAMLGNNDWHYHLARLQDLEYQDLIRLLHNRKHLLKNGFELIGYGHVPPTPFSNKDGERIDIPGAPEEPQRSSPCLSTKEGIRSIRREAFFRAHPTIREELENLPRPALPDRTIYVFHSPPHETGLDLLHDGRHAGSRAIRQFIENRQPFLTLHGHIHESPFLSGRFADRIGNTLCLNPGHSQERLCAVTLEWEDNRFECNHTILGKPGA